jgi:hypothetical protein
MRNAELRPKRRRVSSTSNHLRYLRFSLPKPCNSSIVAREPISSIEARLGQSQSSGYFHQIVDFADHGGTAGTQVLLHAKSCKKG